MQFQTFTTALAALILTYTKEAQAAPTNITSAILPRTNTNEPLVPFGFNVWGFDHLDCQGKPGRRPATWSNMQYDTDYSVGSDTFYSYALTRPLAEEEELQLYTGDVEMDGSWCASLAGTVDWTTHEDFCEEGTWGWVNCVRLVKKA